MAIQKIVRYRTSDGELFTEQRQAWDHESNIQIKANIETFLRNCWPGAPNDKASILEIGQMLFSNIDLLKPITQAKATIEEEGSL